MRVPEMSSESSRVHQAAAEGDHVGVRLALMDVAYIDALNRGGLTALMVAVIGGSDDSVSELLAAGANVNLRTEHNYTCLMMVTGTRIGRALLQAGADVHARPTRFARTPLLHACEFHCDPSWIRMMLEAGADPNVTNIVGITPLHFAVGKPSAHTIAALLRHGSEPTSKASTTDTPLLSGVDNREAVARMLLEAGADVNAGDRSEISVLTRACSHGSVDMVALLIHHGCNVNAVVRTDSSTALMQAVYHGTSSLAEKVRLLLTAGAHADATDAHGKCVLHWLVQGSQPSDPCNDAYTAIQAAQMETVHVLVGAGTKVNLRERTYENTALHNACTRGQGHLVKALLAAGADVNAANRIGMTPLMTAAQAGESSLCHLLVGHGACIDQGNAVGVTALMHATVNGRTAAVDALLRVGACIDAADNCGRTAAMYAVKAARHETLLTLLKHGANIEHTDAGGCTPLYMAVAHGNSVATVKILIDAGADVNHHTATEAPSALMAATQRGIESLVVLLLDAGAQVHYVHPRHFTALRVAVENGALGIVDKLLQAGACVNDVQEGVAGNIIAYTSGGLAAVIVQRLMDEGTDISLIASKLQVRRIVNAYLLKWDARRPAQLDARWRRRRHAIYAWHTGCASDPDGEEEGGVCATKAEERLAILDALTLPKGYNLASDYIYASAIRTSPLAAIGFNAVWSSCSATRR